MLGSLGEGSRELHVELLSERHGLVEHVVMIVALEPRRLLLLQPFKSPATFSPRNLNFAPRTQGGGDCSRQGAKFKRGGDSNV